MTVLRNRLYLLIICFLNFWHITPYAQPVLEFSHERGFYYSGFELSISTRVSGAQIYYTLDGSNPLKPGNTHVEENSARIIINPYITPGRAVTPGITVRAVAVEDNDTSRIETHTYIFPAEVKHQQDVSPSLTPYWPNQVQVPCTPPQDIPNWLKSDYQLIDLGVDPKVVHREAYFSDFENALLSIPTLSLVTDPENLFDLNTGIYINSSWSGANWERAGSIELINDANEGFQCNAGIRIRGGWSSSGVFPKHAFRLFFRKEYGNAKLNFPLFGDEGADSFDKIDLRCSQNNSWHVPGGNAGADFIRDVYMRETQNAMNQAYTRSKFYHLYVNGKYWGLYQSQERSEARYAESYFGGQAEDYDVVKSSGPSADYPPYTLEATDGNLESSNELWQLAKQGFSPVNYNKARGLNIDGSGNPDYPVLLDEHNLIDYIILTYFSANRDGPASLSASDSRINNFFGIYNRENPDGFKYFIHDAENTLNQIGDDITNSPVIAGEEFSGFNPMWLHLQLLKNEDYMQLFADRAYKHLFNGGALTNEKNQMRYQRRVSEIEQAIVGESARWGDVRTSTPYTKHDTWEPVVEYFLENYFPSRTRQVITQFENKNWFNGIIPPAFDPADFDIEHGNVLIENSSFSLTNPNASGDIYYTLDNSDPRAPGGELHTNAILYTNEIDVSSTVFLKTRVKNGDNWSPLEELTILTTEGYDLVISEINYRPIEMVVGDDTLESKSLEFIEIKNLGEVDFDISGYQLSDGINYTFPLNTWLETDSLLVIASDTASFRKLYGFSAYGPFEGSLSNEGEKISLLNPCDNQVNAVEYNTDELWYKAADGTGFTLVFCNYLTEQHRTRKEDWRVSTNWLGSPGKDDPAPVKYDLRINEVLANSSQPYTDAIELYNQGSTDLNIENWYLSDEKGRPYKFKIPANSIIPAEGFLVFNEGHYVNDTLKHTENEFGSAFSISSAGETLYLYAGNDSGRIKHFVTEYEVEPTLNNTSLGYYISFSTDTHQVILDTGTFGEINANVRKSPLVFQTIMYHPADGNPEFMILKNRTDSVLDLFHPADSSVAWKVNGIGFTFPSKVSLGGGDSLFLVEKAYAAGSFKEVMNLDQDALVFNYAGKMKNNSEKLRIQCPVQVVNESDTSYAFANLEVVEYSDDPPWPTNADGDGYALRRADTELFANDVSSWTSVYYGIPSAHAGKNCRVRVGSASVLDGSESGDPRNLALNYNWTIVAAPQGSSVSLSGSETQSPAFTPDVTGEYVFELQVDNGTSKSIPSLVSLYAIENRAPVAAVANRSLRSSLYEVIEIKADLCYDPDYDPLNYTWVLTEQPAGSEAVLDKADQKTCSFTPEIIGNYRIELTVDDGDLYSNPIDLRITVSPSAIVTPEISNRTLIHPNPASKLMNIEFNMERPAITTVIITSLEGKMIYIQNYEANSAGLQQISIDLEEVGIPQGLYIVGIMNNEFKDVKKVLFVPKYSNQ